MQLGIEKELKNEIVNIFNVLKMITVIKRKPILDQIKPDKSNIIKVKQNRCFVIDLLY